MEQPKVQTQTQAQAQAQQEPTKTEEEIEQEIEEQYERDLEFYQEQLIYDKIQDCRDELIDSALIFDYLRYVDINTIINVIYDELNNQINHFVIDELTDRTIRDYECLISTVLDTDIESLNMVNESQINRIHNKLVSMV